MLITPGMYSNATSKTTGLLAWTLALDTVHRNTRVKSEINHHADSSRSETQHSFTDSSAYRPGAAGRGFEKARFAGMNRRRTPPVLIPSNPSSNPGRISPDPTLSSSTQFASFISCLTSGKQYQRNLCWRLATCCSSQLFTSSQMESPSQNCLQRLVLPQSCQCN